MIIRIFVQVGMRLSLLGRNYMETTPEIDIPIEEVINRFSHAKSRKLDFVIQVSFYFRST